MFEIVNAIRDLSLILSAYYLGLSLTVSEYTRKKSRKAYWILIAVFWICVYVREVAK